MGMAILGLSCCKTSLRGVRWHGEHATDGNHRDIDLAEGFDLIFGQFVRQIAQMGDADGAQVEDEGGAFERRCRTAVGRSARCRPGCRSTVVLTLFHSAP